MSFSAQSIALAEEEEDLTADSKPGRATSVWEEQKFIVDAIRGDFAHWFADGGGGGGVGGGGGGGGGGGAAEAATAGAGEDEEEVMVGRRGGGGGGGVSASSSSVIRRDEESPPIPNFIQGRIETGV